MESHKVELIQLSGSLDGVILTEQDLYDLTDTLRAAAPQWRDSWNSKFSHTICSELQSRLLGKQPVAQQKDGSQMHCKSKLS